MSVVNKDKTGELGLETLLDNVADGHTTPIPREPLPATGIINKNHQLLKKKLNCEDLRTRYHMQGIWRVCVNIIHEDLFILTLNVIPL